MKAISRFFLFGALTLVLLSTACAGQQDSPTVTATTQAAATPTISVTSTSTVTITVSPTTTATVVIPVTGPVTASLVCQFCMDTFTYALLDLPAAATFTLLTPPTDVTTSCNSVETVQDRQLVLCQAPSNTSLSMNACRGEDCHQFTVRLQTCPPPPPDPITPTWTPTFTPEVSMSPTPVPPGSTPTSAIFTVTAGSPIATATAGTVTPIITVSPTVTP